MIVLVLIVAAAISWHFSDAVLVPDHSSRGMTTEVVALPPGRVVLARNEESERPGVYALEWPNGHAIVGAIIGEGDATVTRRLLDVRGYLVPEMDAGLESDVYAGNPHQAFGLRSEDVTVPDELGPMPAWLVPAWGRTWAIVAHGINGTPQTGLRLVPTLHRAGLPTLLITYREDQGAPASPDGLHHMGLTEWRDVQAAARFALAHGARRLVLAGYSMGGALVAQFMQKSDLAGRVAGLVLDAPVLDWRRVLEFNATRMGFPGFAAAPVEWAIGARIDADWDSLDALAHPGDFHLPILLFHGEDDKVVPIATSDDFAAELPHWVTYYRFPHAGHTQSWNVDPRLYDQRLGAFLADRLALNQSRPGQVQQIKPDLAPRRRSTTNVAPHRQGPRPLDRQRRARHRQPRRRLGQRRSRPPRGRPPPQPPSSLQGPPGQEEAQLRGQSPSSPR